MNLSVIKCMCLASMAFPVLLLAACEDNPKEWTTRNMTALTPRLQTVFEKTKTVCFGRFMVDVPASSTVVWGNVDIPLSVKVYPAGADEVNNLAQKFIDDLKSEKAINHDDVPLLLSVGIMAQPEGKIITGYEDFQSIDDLRINGYFRLNNDGVVISSRPLREEKDQAIADITSIAQRLRRRTENEVPVEPGNCIEYAFLPDKPGSDGEQSQALIRIGFRLSEFPDTHLSIFVGPSNPHHTESNSLKWQLERLETNLRAEDPNHPQLKTKYLRKGKRQIHGWIDGFEALSRSAEQRDIHSFHDFGMDFRGVPSDPMKPYADVRMQTGVADNVAGATKASLTDEEAIAVWDKITSTIRLRPTTVMTVKSSGADMKPRIPLGELAATGRVCPQTGWWEPDESHDRVAGQRQHIKAGEQMPHLVTYGKPSLWQKFKGEQPACSMATVWKLASYDDSPVCADTEAQSAAIAHVSSSDLSTIKNAMDETSADGPSPEASSP